LITVPVGPIIGGGIGYAVSENEAAAAAGVTAGFMARKLTLGQIGAAAYRSAIFAAPRIWAASNFIRFGTAATSIGLGTAAAATAYGYALGATVGTAASWLLFGEEGRDDAIELYTSPVTGEVSLSEWADAVTSIPELLEQQRSAWEAVPGNAAGLPAGTQINPTTGRPETPAAPRTATVSRYYEAYMAGQDIRY
jgi:hypothetical protein